MKYSALSQYRTELMGGAMLWVMLYHAWGLNFQTPALTLIQKTGFGGVDIFILLSAMGLTVSLSRREQTYGAFLARRAGRLLPAYYTVMLPYTLSLILRGLAGVWALLWNSTFLSFWVVTPLNVILGSRGLLPQWLSDQGCFNWYIPAILALYLMTPPLFRLMRSVKRKALFAALGAAAGFALARFIIHCDDWIYLDLVYRLPVFFMGMLMGFYVVEDRPLSWKSLLFWGASLAAGIVYLNCYQSVPGVWLPLCHLFILTTVPTCLLACAAFTYLPLGGVRWCLRVVGESSLEIYLLNVSLFTEDAFFHSLLPLTPKRYYLVLFLLNILCGVLLHRAIAWIGGRGKAFLAAHTNHRADP